MNLNHMIQFRYRLTTDEHGLIGYASRRLDAWAQAKDNAKKLGVRVQVTDTLRRHLQAEEFFDDERAEGMRTVDRPNPKVLRTATEHASLA